MAATRNDFPHVEKKISQELSSPKRPFINFIRTIYLATQVRLLGGFNVKNMTRCFKTLSGLLSLLDIKVGKMVLVFLDQ